MIKIKTGNVHLRYLLFSLCLLLNIILYPTFTSAQTEEEIKILKMYFKEDELVVTPTRTIKPISQVAENISVITAKDIKDMNAHTLTDVLNIVPGVQMDIRGGPGSETRALIQGSDFKHVLVMIDGVTFNNLSDNFADISAIPVQNIERVEVIKGSASSSWGSSLGGVINIITKPVEGEEKMRGAILSSYGERGTGDYRAEVSGGENNFGYYIYAGNLTSGGLRPNTNFFENNLYTKLKLDINNKTDIIFTFGYNKGSRGRGEDPEFDLSFSNDFEYLFSTLSMNYSITDAADLSLSLRTSRQNTEFFWDQMSTGDNLMKSTFDDTGNGGSMKLMWKQGINNIVVGADYDNGELESNSITDEMQHLEKWAVFANDTITINEFSFNPGIRYDHTTTNGDFLSPSIGVTYTFDERSILRGYVARGFNIPSLSETFGTGFFSVPNPDLEVEKVLSIQAGIESTVLKYLWLRASLFRHYISDAIFDEELPDGTFTSANKEKQRRQGFELEVKTIPVYNVSLLTGFIYVNAKNRDTGEKLPGIPEYTYDFGTQYSDNKSFKALLKGHYIWWNSTPFVKGKYNSFIWDIHLTKSTFKNDDKAIELYFSAHNIFNGSQYLMEVFKNPGRWIEGGVRLTF